MKKTYSLALALVLGAQVGITFANDQVLDVVVPQEETAAVVQAPAVETPAAVEVAPAVEVAFVVEKPVVDGMHCFGEGTPAAVEVAPAVEVAFVVEKPVVDGMHCFGEGTPAQAKPSKLTIAKQKAATVCAACMALLKDKSVATVQFVGNISKPALKAVTYFGGADWLAKNSAVFKTCTNEYVIRTATGVVVITGVTAAVLYQIKQALAEINEEDADEENEEIYFDYEG